MNAFIKEMLSTYSVSEFYSFLYEMLAIVVNLKKNNKTKQNQSNNKQKTPASPPKFWAGF